VALTPWIKKLYRYLPYVYIAGYETGIYLAGDAVDIPDTTWGYKVTSTWTRATNDDRIMTSMQLMNYTGGAVDPSWTTADFTTAETQLNTFWTSVSARMPTGFTLESYRWYPFGPTITAPNPARRITTPAGISGGSSTYAYPHQISCAVTERTSDRLHWGRMYLPPLASSASQVGVDGRFVSTHVDAIAGFANTLYTGLSGVDLQPVVWSPAKPARINASGNTLPATSAAAYSVEKIQVDNVPDVIRSRRPLPTYRKIYP